MTAREQRRSDDPVLSLLRGGDLPPADETLWDRIARDCVTQGLAGAALTLLGASGGLAAIPPSARDTLERELTRVRVAQAILFHRFESLARLMHERKIEFIVHKGGALAPLVYPRLEDRPMVDIDVIIRPRDWPRARAALLSAGYRVPEGALQAFWLENYFNLALRSPEDPASHFDLHWSLTQEGRYHVSTDELFDRAVPYQLGGVPLQRLGDEDLLLSLFLHLAYHYFDAHLIWLCDMERVIERFPISWDVLMARARAWGLLTVTAFNFAYLEKVYPGLVPAEVAARARPGALRRAIARPFLSPYPRHLFRAGENRLVQLLLGLIAIDRPADAARFASDKLSRSLKWVGRRPPRR